MSFHSWLAAIAPVAIGTAISLSIPAFAADMPAAMPVKAPAAVVYNWTGFYLGGHASYGWSNSQVELSPGHPNAVQFFALGAVPPSLGTEPNGFLGGVQFGYNYQRGAVVYGIEADISYSNIRGSGSETRSPDPVNIINITSDAEQKLDWFGTLRARLGLTQADRSLLYATGGLAAGHATLSTSLTAAPPFSCATAICPSASTSKALVGWTAGAGAERAFANNWSAKIEYLYYDIGDISHSFVDARFPVGATFIFNAQADYRGHIVRVGLNYKFGGTVAAGY